MTDGRAAVGTVDVIGDVFIASDTAGTVVGTFASLQLAARSLPGGAP